MKILVYSHVPMWEQHHAESIEICLKHLNCGDEVFMLACDMSLSHCPANFLKNKNFCNRCLKQTERTKITILENKIKHLYLELGNDDNNVAVNSVEEFSNFKFDNVPFGEFVLSTLIGDYLQTSYYNFDDIIKANGLEMMNSSINLYKRVQKIITENNIDRVYTWNGRRASDAPVNYAAKKMKIQFFSHISGGTRDKFQIESAISVLDVDLYKKVSNGFYEEHKKNGTLKEFEKEGLNHFNFLRYGNLEGYSYGLQQFSKNFDKKNIFEKKKNKKNISIFPGSNWEYLAFANGLDKIDGKSFSQYNMLEKVLSNNYIKDNFNLYVRWHPYLQHAGSKEKKHIYEIKDKYNHVNFFMPESNANSYNLLDFSDVVITFGSTMGVEATIYGKPSILLGRTFWEDSGAAYIAKSTNDLIILLKEEKLKPKPFINAIKEGYYQRHRSRESFEYVTSDPKKVKYFLKNKRIKNLTIYDKVKEATNYDKVKKEATNFISKTVVNSNSRLSKFYGYLRNYIF